MSGRALRWLPVAVLAWGLFGQGGCYRAVIDIAEADAGSPSDEAGAAGAAGAAAMCDSTQVEGSDLDCRTHLPSRAQCSVQDPNGWNGCYNGGCSVCADVVQKFPYYFSWHPCCDVNSYCTSQLRVKCNDHCPEPVAHDQVRPCWSTPPRL